MTNDRPEPNWERLEATEMREDAAEAPVVVETTPSVCRHCKEPAVFCEAHASELVAQAFAEDEANTLEQVTRGAERSLRRSDANTPNRAAAVREVLVRWFGRGALNVAREVVQQLELTK